MAWTYSDWITKTSSSERLSQLRLHIQEVSNAVQANQTVNVNGRQIGKFALVDYLKDLRAEEKALAEATGQQVYAQGNRRTWTRARVIP